jgi:excisionase family DNA binding protein
MAMPTIDTDKLLSPAQAAEIMGVSKRRVQKLCEEGRIGVRIVDRFYIDRDDAKKFRPNPPGRPAAK